ncbi:MAG: phage late control D family protein, partial [Pigmentiphaga sp.]
KGRPDLSPQQPVQLIGFKPQISSISWLIKRVEHALDDGGLRTRVELETQGADGASEDAF